MEEVGTYPGVLSVRLVPRPSSDIAKVRELGAILLAHGAVVNERKKHAELEGRPAGADRGEVEAESVEIPASNADPRRWHGASPGAMCLGFGMSDHRTADVLEAQADRLDAMAGELRAEAARIRSDHASPSTSATLLSLEQACTASGLSMSAVRRMLDEGRLDEVKAGRRRFVTRTSLDALTRAQP
jgi:hypothetical protein